MGVAMNTVGVDTSLTRFSPVSAPSSKSRSTIAQLYGVDAQALTAAGPDAQALTAAGPSVGNCSPQQRMPPRAWRVTTARPDSLTAAGAVRGVKKPSRRHPIHRWFAKVNLGRVVHLQRA